MSQSEPSPDFGGELLSATVKRLVLDRIIQGHYRPGERIVEFKLAKELGLSQSPVREGLRELAAVGIVTIHPRRGARVRLPSAKELADVSLVRAEIDALAARLAAARISDADLDALEELVEEMLDPAGRRRLLRRDRGRRPVPPPHRRGLGEPRPRARPSTSWRPFARTFITLTLPDVDVRGIVLEHRPILEALRARDAEAAAEAARVHQLSVSQLLQSHFPAALGDPTRGQGDDVR